MKLNYRGFFVCFKTMSLLSIATGSVGYYFKYENDKWYGKCAHIGTEYFHIEEQGWEDFLNKHYKEYLTENILLGDNNE